MGSEPELVRREQEFDELVTLEYGRVYRASFAFLQDREAALDVTQEAFARAFARWHRLAGTSWAGAWVMTTALNLCKRHVRKEKLVNAVQVLPERAVREEAVDARRADVMDAVQRLPVRQRQVVLLHYFGDLSVEAIAQLLGLSAGGVKANLFKARRTLSRNLNLERGIDELSR